MNAHIDRSAAEQLLDFARHIGPGQRANEQLDGAVALYNTLVDHGVAYLADEVGMGKTYVALGVLALLRHFKPTARVLVIAPRENIQHKWQGELINVVRGNVRFADLRVKAPGGRPVVSMVECGNLVELAEEAARDPDRDFFMRLPSFSVALRAGSTGDEGARGLRDRIEAVVPWMGGVLDLRSSDFKRTLGAAINCILPSFDLVIIDEAHNLKHGRGASASDRNQVLARVLGHPSDAPAIPQLAAYKRLAKWTLLLSATPVEDSYRHLWNQLDLVGHGDKWRALTDDKLDEDEIKQVIQKFLIRRVTTIDVAGSRLTKNLYRREWRRGGLDEHDHPIEVKGDRQRLVLALVQKKVSELLPEQEFGARFQIGMLASFESFLETSKLQGAEDEDPNFDDSEQTQDLREREGIDSHDLRLLTKSYRREFGAELPHPKMDAVVGSLSDVWEHGRKALIFVRRVKSVKELKERLDDTYDAWLFKRLEDALPTGAWTTLQPVIAQYRDEKREARDRGRDDTTAVRSRSVGDARGTDTFFAWFFRGDPRPGILDGPRLRERYYDDTVFFEDNLVAAILGCTPGQVATALAAVLGIDASMLRDGMGRRAARYLRRGRTERAERFRAAQVAALDWLAEEETPMRALAAALRGWVRHSPPRETQRPVDVLELLEVRTFFTELRQRPTLERRIWPEPTTGTDIERGIERLARGAMLSACARLGHAFIDLYEISIRRLGDVSVKSASAGETDETHRIQDYLDHLEGQMNQPVTERGWRAFDELADLASHFDLVCRVNKLDLLTAEPAKVRSTAGTMFGRQQPVGGMAGSVNATLVHQFRQPGYPLVLVTTDVLQEGEDLHTFCSTILHYGISWTPSAMEQRTGRVDRVGSATDRRLATLLTKPEGEELLQVHFPYLEDTVEVLQVDRVFERMNTFLRLMHKGLRTETASRPHVDVATEMANGRRHVEPIREVLDSAFGVPADRTRGEIRALAVGAELGETLRARFSRLAEQPLPGVDVRWVGHTSPVLRGTMILESRTQPIALYLRSFHGRPVVRCISPVGELAPNETMDKLRELATDESVRIGAIFDDTGRTYDVTVEGEVLLADEAHDAARVAALIARVARQADHIEHERLGLDQPLVRFEADLLQEDHAD